MKNYIVAIIILLIVIALSIGGFFIYSNIMNNKSNEAQTLNEKCLAEIDYLSTNIISMMNGLNNISYTNYRIVSEEIKVSEDENSSGEGSTEGQSNRSKQ